MDVFDLSAKISLDKSEYDKGLDEASKKTGGVGEKLKGMGGAIGSGLATAAKAGVAAVGTATAAVGTLAKASLDGYAQYEQLVGGVETLYGTTIKSIEEYAKSVGKSVSEVGYEYEEMMNRQNTVIENAKNAYQTAGMSANDYMETVNGFAASLTSSLGEYEWQAASYADMIVTDMSDKMSVRLKRIEPYQGCGAKRRQEMAA